MSWNARTSSVGGYAACTMRAWLDHGLQAGHLPLKDWGINPQHTRTSSPPADFGSCCHWYSQAAMRCQFKPDKQWNDMEYTGWDDEACQAAKPTVAQFNHGYSMFATPQEGEDIMKQMAVDIQQKMPRSKKTKWLAESCFEIAGLLNGHIDFLSDDWLDIVDLKTTATKPGSGKPKPAHIWQLIGYALGVYTATGVVPENGYIIYAHSRGDWIFRSNPVKFRSPIVQLLMRQLVNRLQIYADWNKLSEVATPSFGDPCNDFCPYTHCCRDAVIPRGLTIRDRPLTTLTSTNPI